MDPNNVIHVKLTIQKIVIVFPKYLLHLPTTRSPTFYSPIEDSTSPCLRSMLQKFDDNHMFLLIYPSFPPIGNNFTLVKIGT